MDDVVLAMSFQSSSISINSNTNGSSSSITLKVLSKGDVRSLDRRTVVLMETLTATAVGVTSSTIGRCVRGSGRVTEGRVIVSGTTTASSVSITDVLQ